MPKKLTILERADRLVNVDRRNDYGHPAENFADIATMWSMILGVEVQPRQVGLCMIAVKLSREAHVPKQDNLIDIAGYAKTVDLVDNSE